MPKPKLYTSKYLLRGLKWKIEQSVGFKLNTIKACEKLSELILMQLGENISSITLYRMFLKNNSDYRPYKHTLDLLSQFLKFENWDSLQVHINEITHFKLSIGFVPNSKENLLKECIQYKAFKPLDNFFNKIEIGDNELFKEFLGDSIYESLRKGNERDNNSFFEVFSGHDIVRASFFEFLADPEFNIKGYEYGLKKYFETSKSVTELIGIQDKVFSTCLLTRHYYKKNHLKKFKESSCYLYNDLEFSRDIENIHIFPRFRYHCYRLLYVHANNPESLDLEIDKLFDYIKITLQKEQVTVGLSKIIIHTLADTLGLMNKLSKEYRRQIELLFPLTFESLPSFYGKLNNEAYLELIDPNASTFWNGFRFI